MVIELKRITETNLSYRHYCNITFKLLYASNKTERFSYKGGCGLYGCMHIKVFKRRAGLGYR